VVADRTAVVGGLRDGGVLVGEALLRWRIAAVSEGCGSMQHTPRARPPVTVPSGSPGSVPTWSDPLGGALVYLRYGLSSHQHSLSTQRP
jgi:hypothetical protein